jgi:hypothetical protein
MTRQAYPSGQEGTTDMQAVRQADILRTGRKDTKETRQKRRIYMYIVCRQTRTNRNQVSNLC